MVWGPGGGGRDNDDDEGGGAGHAREGQTAAYAGFGGPIYGNTFLIPLVGGSGGGGGGTASWANFTLGGGGGAGGGALLLASNTKIELQGQIMARGGNGGQSYNDGFGGFHGGSGSGGAIRLAAPEVTGLGAINTEGGTAYRDGSEGRIRIESENSGEPSLSLNGDASFGFLRPLVPPAMPSVRVRSIAGVEVESLPPAGFPIPFYVIEDSAPTTVTLVARGIPAGTQLDVTLVTEEEGPLQSRSSPLRGTLTESEAEVTFRLPRGFANGYVHARW